MEYTDYFLFLPKLTQPLCLNDSLPFVLFSIHFCLAQVIFFFKAGAQTLSSLPIFHSYPRLWILFSQWFRNQVNAYELTSHGVTFGLWGTRCKWWPAVKAPPPHSHFAVLFWHTTLHMVCLKVSHVVKLLAMSLWESVPAHLDIILPSFSLWFSSPSFLLF